MKAVTGPDVDDGTPRGDVVTPVEETSLLEASPELVRDPVLVLGELVGVIVRGVDPAELRALGSRVEEVGVAALAEIHLERVRARPVLEVLPAGHETGPVSLATHGASGVHHSEGGVVPCLSQPAPPDASRCPVSSPPRDERRRRHRRCRARPLCTGTSTRRNSAPASPPPPPCRAVASHSRRRPPPPPDAGSRRGARCTRRSSCPRDRKSTRLNSSHVKSSYAV